ncbi:MAG: hypothetical protein QGG67_13125 [Gammaproteobacteria bacterium]|jgi:hypothetical protein|nr:hypothetical protein [Gammaproteobacteria bacterium]|tara:strand:+ start:3068 stop:4090 length:1023 start_codon:yes stop_codon:yes gene_type:complete
MSLKNKVIIASGLALSLTSISSHAQDSSRPELTGAWTNASRTGLTRITGVDPLVVTGEQAEQLVSEMAIAGISPENVAAGPAIDPDTGAPPAGGRDFGLRGYNLFWTDPGATLAYVKGEFRTSYIINPENGQVPRLENPTTDFQRTSYGSRYLTGVATADGPEDLPLSERCVIFDGTAGPAMRSSLYNNNYQFVQTDDYVMIEVEQIHDARIIPTFGSAEEARANRRPEALQQWMGDSVGWYEDGALVVETININPLQMQQSSTSITANGKVTERFSRYSDTEIVYQFTVEDADLYSQPWTAELSFHATDDQLYEYACHEGNYSMPGILAGARRLEAEKE